MGPVTREILADLKELLRAKGISFAEYQEGVAAAHSRVLAAQSPSVMSSEKCSVESVNVSLSNMVLDESVSVSSSIGVVSVSVGASASESLLVLAEEQSTRVAKPEIWLEDIDTWGYVKCQGCGHRFRATDECYWCWEEAQGAVSEVESLSGVGVSATTGKGAYDPE